MTRAPALAAALVLLVGCAHDQDTRRFRVPSSSMEPTLHCARPAPGCEGETTDRVAVHAYGDRAPKRGDIVVFRTPPAAATKCGSGGTFIKRVVGLPGERWSERRGLINIDGKELAEPYIHPDRRDDMTFRGGVIPSREYLLLGDNRASSCDSREWGLVPRRNLIGVVFEIKRGSRRFRIR